MKRSVLVWSCCAALLGSACGGGNNVDPNTPDGGSSASDGGGPAPDGGGGTPDGGGNAPDAGGGTPDAGGGTPDAGGGTPDAGGGTPDAGGPTGTTVTGKVLPGRGSAGRTLTVLIPGGGRQPVTVEDSGSFSVPNVVTPYELIIANKARRVATVYQGLTLTSPSLSFDEDSDARPARSGKVEGTVTGGVSSNQTQVAFVSEGTSSPLIADSNTGSYSLSVDWDGANTLAGTLYAFESEFNPAAPFNPPPRYVATGRRDNVTVTANGTLSGQNLALSPATNSSVSGSATLPTGYVTSSIAVAFVPPSGNEVNLFSDTSRRSTFQYAVPQLPASTFSLRVSASDDSAPSSEAGTSGFIKRGVSAGATQLSLPLQAAPRLAQPAANARDVTRSTVFSWSSYAGGVHQLQLSENQTGGQTPYTVRILTRAAQTSLPDLSPLGLALPATTRFVWLVQGLGPVNSVDALVELLAKGDPIKSGTGDFGFGVSAPRVVTTAASP